MTWPAWLPRRPHLPFGKPPCPDRAGWRGLSALLLMHEITLHGSGGRIYIYHDHASRGFDLRQQRSGLNVGSPAHFRRSAGTQRRSVHDRPCENSKFPSKWRRSAELGTVFVAQLDERT